jgi:hypothetical protein
VSDIHWQVQPQPLIGSLRHHDSVEDPLPAFTGVQAALRNLDKAAVLGRVLNGTATDAELDREWELRESRLADESGQPPAADEEWSRRVGKHYEALVSDTTFAVGGTTHIPFSQSSLYDKKGATRHVLQILKGGEVIRSWPLDSPLPVGELLQYCSPAAYGDLKTNTTRVDSSVRLAFEMLAEPTTVNQLEGEGEPWPDLRKGKEDN